MDAFKHEASQKVSGCNRCNGALDVECECTAKFRFEVEAFEACIPRAFWYVSPEDVEFNTRPFNETVLPYAKRLSTAHREGYGLFFHGSNGVGKTMFMSFVLTRAIRRGKSVYYTTLLQLDHDIKKGFDDREASVRLDLMLTSDFLGFDEMGKESMDATGKPKFIRGQVERILKQRFDDSKPVLLATNLSESHLTQTYGGTIMSIIKGKYKKVEMEPGDIRGKFKDKMSREMGFK